MTAEVTVRAGDGTPVGRVVLADGGNVSVQVLREADRGLVEAVAATMRRQRPPRARAACAGEPAPRGGRIVI